MLIYLGHDAKICLPKKSNFYLYFVSVHVCIYTCRHAHTDTQRFMFTAAEINTGVPCTINM